MFCCRSASVPEVENRVDMVQGEVEPAVGVGGRTPCKLEPPWLLTATNTCAVSAGVLVENGVESADGGACCTGVGNELVDWRSDD